MATFEQLLDDGVETSEPTLIVEAPGDYPFSSSKFQFILTVVDAAGNTDTDEVSVQFDLGVRADIAGPFDPDGENPLPQPVMRSTSMMFSGVESEDYLPDEEGSLTYRWKAVAVE